MSRANLLRIKNFLSGIKKYTVGKEKFALQFKNLRLTGKDK